jgi:hypothetical protein
MYIVAGVALFAACNDDEKEEDRLTVTPADLTFSQNDATVQTVAVETNVTDWNFETSAMDDWMIVTRDDGALTVSVQPYVTASAQRIGEITIKAGRAEKQTVTVTQLAAAIEIEPATLVFRAGETGAAAAQTVQVLTDAAEWTFEAGADWLTLSKSGNGLVVSPKEVNMSNDPDGRRTASITVKTGNRTPAILQITQEPVRTRTYADLLGEYTLTAEVIPTIMDYFPNGFSKTLTLEALEEGVSYKATIEGYLPENAFFADYAGGFYEQYELEVNYSNGNLVIPNGQLIALDADEPDLESPTVYIWLVLYLAVSSDGGISDNEDLNYVGWNGGSFDRPVFTFRDGGTDPDFQVNGFIPYWWNVVPGGYPEYFDFPDDGLYLYDWVLAKKDPISKQASVRSPQAPDKGKTSRGLKYDPPKAGIKARVQSAASNTMVTIDRSQAKPVKKLKSK